MADLKRLVYRTFSDSLTNIASGTSLLKLITFESDKFALELFLDISFNSGTDTASFLLEVDNSGKFFVRNISISEEAGEAGRPSFASFDPSLSFAINNGAIYLKTDNAIDPNTFYSITAKKLIKYGDVSNPSISVISIEPVELEDTYIELSLVNLVDGNLEFYSNYTNELKIDGRLLLDSSDPAAVRIEDYIVTSEEATEDFPVDTVVQRLVTPFISVTQGITGITLDSLDVDFAYSNNLILPVSITTDNGSKPILMELTRDGNLSLPAGTLSVSGQTTLTGQLNINGGLNSDSGVFTVADTTGNISTSGTLTVAGITTLSEDLLIKDGATTKVTIDNASGDILTAGSLTVSGGNIFCANTDGTGTFNIGSANLNPTNAILNLGSQPILTGARTINIGTRGAPGTDTTVNIGSALEDPTHSIINLYGTVNVIGGTGSVVTTDELNVENNEIVLNSSLTGVDSPFEGLSGVVIKRGSQVNATLYWNEDTDTWDISNSLSIANGSSKVSFTAPTASATVTLPTATGTLALVSQIPSSFNLTDGILEGSANSYAPYTSRAAGKIYDTDTTAPSTTTNTLNYDGIFRSSQLFEGSTRVLTAATDNILDASITSGNLTYAPYAVGDKSAGRIYSGTTNPTNTTRLNYDGVIYASYFVSTNSAELVTSFSTSTTLGSSHANKLVTVDNGSSNIVITLGTDINAFPIGTEVAFFRNGTGNVDFAVSSVTLNSDGGKRRIKSQYSSAAIKKIGSSTWALVGNLSAIV
jgi:hypothetical protein